VEEASSYPTGLFFMVVSAVGQILAAKQCDSMKCSANRIRSFYLRKQVVQSSETVRTSLALITNPLLYQLSYAGKDAV
jgi:hypothetical protein